MIDRKNRTISLLVKKYDFPNIKNSFKSLKKSAQYIGTGK